MKRIVPAAAIVAFAVPFLACFGRVLFRGEQFAYRDAAHFYYPLYHLVESEWDAGRTPLWETAENAGMPLLGNPTAAVLYPGKVIYRLLPYAWGARLYTIVHVGLAFGLMLACLRHFRISAVGSVLGALSYAFAGPILFQYCNIIFLVGAAWLPLAVMGADAWVRERKSWGAIALAIAFTMQVLGGDPETAYLAGICAGGYAVALALPMSGLGRSAGAGWFFVACAAVVYVLLALGLASIPAFLAIRDRLALAGIAGKAVRAAAPLIWLTAIPWPALKSKRKGTLKGLGLALVGLAAAAGLAGLLTSAQLLPSLEYAAATSRAADEGPHEIFPFSVSPYRTAELALPGVFGRMMPRNSHWLPLLPPRGDMHIWVPSLYMGGLACVLGLSALGFRGAPAWRRWMSAILIASMLAGFGSYASPVWWARQTREGVKRLGPHDREDLAMRVDGFMPDGEASPYGLLAIVLPGFRQFRYPGKLMTFSCFALAALAAAGWDLAAAGRRGKALAIAAALAAICLAGAAAWPIVREPLAEYLKRRGSVHVSGFGPFDAKEAVRLLLRCMIISTIVYSNTILILWAAQRRPRLAGAWALLLAGADLAIAGTDLVITAEQSLFEREPKALGIIKAYERDHPADGPYRIFRMHAWEPPQWSMQGSDRRTTEFVEWEGDTLQPKYGLLSGVSYTATRGTAELYDYDWFFGPFPMTIDPLAAQALKRASFGQAPLKRRIVCYPRKGFDLWNTRYFLVPINGGGWSEERRSYASFLPNSEPIYPDRDELAKGTAESFQNRVSREDFQVLLNKDAFPRAWIVHEVRPIDPVEGLSRDARNGPMTTLLYKDDGFWSDSRLTELDARRSAIVETRDRAILRKLSGGAVEPNERVTVHEISPVETRLEAALSKPGLVILADIFYPGWRLEIDGKPAPIIRANRMMRGAIVAAGKHTLTYRYDPDSYRIGKALSLAGLVVLAAASAGILTRALPRGTLMPRNAITADPTGAQE